MKKKNFKLSVIITVVALSLSLFSGCAGKNDPAASPEAAVPESSVSPETAVPSPTPNITKSDIDSALASYGDNAIDIAWSPDNSTVAFVKLEGKSSNVCLWKVGEENAKILSSAEPTMDGFCWSPNSEYFLINVGHMGPGTITSTLFEAETLEIVSSELSTVSLSPPVWSPDSRFLALSTWADYNTAEILAFAIASKTTASLIKMSNTYGSYVIESWTSDNVIKYTEMTNSSTRVENTIELGE